MSTPEVVWINVEDQIVYSTTTTHTGLDRDEFARFVTEAKSRIANREYVLDRYEPWEIPDGDIRKVGRLLMGRARNRVEKDLVNRYLAMASK